MPDLAETPPEPWVIHCDGSAVPNPGRMGMGAVMIDPQGRCHTLSLASQATGCNNEAELLALMAALRELKSLGAAALSVFSDNSILVAQLTGDGGPPIARLAALFDEARALLVTFEQVHLQWIPRHRNGQADALARAALGLPLKLAPKPRKRPRKR